MIQLVVPAAAVPPSFPWVAMFVKAMAAWISFQYVSSFPLPPSFRLLLPWGENGNGGCE